MNIIAILVPVMLLGSSFLMAFAWLGHIKYKHKGFLIALLCSWFLVLPEYLLNVGATRWGLSFYEPSEMAAINLCTGVICVTIVSKVFLNEVMTTKKILGFGLMAVAVVLVMV